MYRGILKELIIGTEYAYLTYEQYQALMNAYSDDAAFMELLGKFEDGGDGWYGPDSAMDMDWIDYFLDLDIEIDYRPYIKSTETHGPK